MRYKKFILPLLLVAVAIWWWMPSNIAVLQPEKVAYIQAVYGTGTVEAVRQVPLASRSSARLLELLVDEGAKVQAGDLLARLEATDTASDVIDREAALAQAERDLARQRVLLARGVVANNAVDDAASAVTRARAQLERARAQNNFLEIRAPQDGEIIRRDGEVGELITPSQPLFWLAAGGLRIVAEIDEEDVPLLAVGQSAMLRADALPGKIIQARLATITPKGDAVARSFRVRLDVPDADELRIGMNVEVNIQTAPLAEKLALPATAVRNNQVALIADGVIKRQAVEWVLAKDGRAIMLSGLAADDLVARDVVEAPIDGVRVRPKLVKQPANSDASRGVMVP